MPKPEDYKYSSYNYYAEGKKDDLLTEDMFYKDLDKNQQSSQKAYREIIVNEVISESYLKPVWGSDYQRYHEIRKAKYHL
ncbi:TPA: hypothetical protein DHW59_02210 [candidate division CPR2 bacterium]|nr:hypothetical protein [candidate division CPR2 bacterium]